MVYSVVGSQLSRDMVKSARIYYFTSITVKQSKPFIAQPKYDLGG